MPLSHTTCKELELALQKFLTELRTEFNSIESMHRFNFDIKVEGRTDGDLKVEYVLGANYHPDVKGGTIFPLVTETVRRFDWDARNAPLCLPKVDANVTPSAE